MTKPKRGFALLAERNPELLKRLSAKGGKVAHERGLAHEFTAEEASRAGHAGGLVSQKRRREHVGVDTPE